MNPGDLGDLTAFVAAADQLSFRAAASRLGVTPSALSHSMRQLEERLGVRLLHRTTRSVSVAAGNRSGCRRARRLEPRGVIGPCRHDPKPAREPCEALVRAIHQQLIAKAGDAIWIA